VRSPHHLTANGRLLTKAALAVKRAQGVRLGRPAVLDLSIVDRIVSEHAAGKGWSEIARGLNADGTPTAQGGTKWHPSTVRYVAVSHAA